MSEFMENGNSMRGMEFSVEGIVTARYPRDEGLGLSVEVENDGDSRHLFIVVPSGVGETNIEREQPYSFKINIEEGGIAVASAVKRL